MYRSVDWVVPREVVMARPTPGRLRDLSKSEKRKRDAKLLKRRKRSKVKGYPKRTVWY